MAKEGYAKTRKKEEITDMIAETAYADPKFKKGVVLKFETASLRITRVDRANKRTWAEHVILFDAEVPLTHQDHELDDSDEQLKKDFVPFCLDCQTLVTIPASEVGNSLSRLRIMQLQEETKH